MRPFPTPTRRKVSTSTEVGCTASASAATARLASDRGTLARNESPWRRGATANIVAIADRDRIEYMRPNRPSVSPWSCWNSRTRITQTPQNCPKLQ